MKVTFGARPQSAFMSRKQTLTQFNGYSQTVRFSASETSVFEGLASLHQQQNRIEAWRHQNEQIGSFLEQLEAVIPRVTVEEPFRKVSTATGFTQGRHLGRRVADIEIDEEPYRFVVASEHGDPAKPIVEFSLTHGVGEGSKQFSVFQRSGQPEQPLIAYGVYTSEDMLCPEPRLAYSSDFQIGAALHGCSKGATDPLFAEVSEEVYVLGRRAREVFEQLNAKVQG